jgi:hypothetical protein
MSSECGENFLRKVFLYLFCPEKSIYGFGQTIRNIILTRTTDLLKSPLAPYCSDIKGMI